MPALMKRFQRTHGEPARVPARYAKCRRRGKIGEVGVGSEGESRVLSAWCAMSEVGGRCEARWCAANGCECQRLHLLKVNQMASGESNEMSVIVYTR